MQMPNPLFSPTHHYGYDVPWAYDDTIYRHNPRPFSTGYYPEYGPYVYPPAPQSHTFFSNPRRLLLLILLIIVLFWFIGGVRF